MGASTVISPSPTEMDGRRLHTAFLLAAGHGTRMRPLTEHRPKPMLALAGKTLIDHVLDRLLAVGIGRAIVNVHYQADQLLEHLSQRLAPQIEISDERSQLLDTGGGVKRVLGRIGSDPFLIHNTDSVWLEAGQSPNLVRLLSAWRDRQMDSLLLLARRDTSLGYVGAGDFHIDDDGRLIRRTGSATSQHVFAGVSIAHPRLFAGTPDGPFSLNLVWDRAIARGRLYGIELEGRWMHVGTPQALAEAEALIAAGAGLG